MRIEVLQQIAKLDNSDLNKFGKGIEEIFERENIIFKDKNGLTMREGQVLKLVSAGNSNQEIADKLFISRRTVEIHRANLLKKLHLKSQTEQLIEYVKSNEVK